MATIARKSGRAAQPKRPSKAASAKPAGPKVQAARHKPAANETPRAKSGGFGAFLRKALVWTAALGVWVAVAVIAVVAWYGTDLPDVDEALAQGRRPSVSLLAADGSTIASFGDLYGAPVQLHELPPALPQAVMATEDRRFYGHFGVDLIGLARAFVTNIMAGRVVQGGSTITQQVAKNLFLSPDRTIKRKIQEVLLALWLEHRFTKDQILTVYLNRVYLGAGTYGVDAAARKYFDKSARQVNLYEAAMLAGLLKAPSRYSPAVNPDLAVARTKQVLKNMVAAGYLTEKQAATGTGGAAARVAGVNRNRVPARYFADWVMEQVDDYVGPAEGDRSVVTTLDPVLQARAQALIADYLASPKAKAANVSQAAVVVLDPDGAVRAMVGGRDWGASQFNRATQARRQPGSAFKPFVYLAGLEAGLTPDSILDDAPITLQGWSPKNYSGRFDGPMTMADALAGSVNTVAVRVAEAAGRNRVIGVAKRLGITADLGATPSLALGVDEVSPLELAAAYAPFANGGYGVLPYGLKQVRDDQGRAVYSRSGDGLGRVIDGDHLAQMNRMLAGVIAHGTGRAAALDRPAAGKTGTSQDSRDAWFAGFTADRVAVVWLGNDDGSPMKKVTGGGAPAALWHDVMTAAHQGLAPRALPGGSADRPATPPAQGAPAAPPEDGLWGRILSVFN